MMEKNKENWVHFHFHFRWSFPFEKNTHPGRCVTLNLFKWFHFMTSIDLSLFLIIIFIFIQYFFLHFFWLWKFNFFKNCCISLNSHLGDISKQYKTNILKKKTIDATVFFVFSLFLNELNENKIEQVCASS